MNLAEYPLFTPCCRKSAALYGVADRLGGVHWCPCGMPWRMRDLVALPLDFLLTGSSRVTRAAAKAMAR